MEHIWQGTRRGITPWGKGIGQKGVGGEGCGGGKQSESIEHLPFIRDPLGSIPPPSNALPLKRERSIMTYHDKPLLYMLI